MLDKSQDQNHRKHQTDNRKQNNNNITEPNHPEQQRNPHENQIAQNKFVLTQLFREISQNNRYMTKHDHMVVRNLIAQAVNTMSPEMIELCIDNMNRMDDTPTEILNQIIPKASQSQIQKIIKNTENIHTHILLDLTSTGNIDICNAIAQRKNINPVICRNLIAMNHPKIIYTLLFNHQTQIPENILSTIIEKIIRQPKLLRIIIARPDMTLNLVLTIFWHADPELRAFIITKFIRTSDEIQKIMEIIEPSKKQKITPEKLKKFIYHASMGENQNAAHILQEIAHITHQTALKVVKDPNGEPLAIIAKAVNLPRTDFKQLCQFLQNAPHAALAKNTPFEKLLTLYDTITADKARIITMTW